MLDIQKSSFFLLLEGFTLSDTPLCIDIHCILIGSIDHVTLLATHSQYQAPTLTSLIDWFLKYSHFSFILIRFFRLLSKFCEYYLQMPWTEKKTFFFPLFWQQVSYAEFKIQAEKWNIILITAVLEIVFQTLKVLLSFSCFLYINIYIIYITYIFFISNFQKDGFNTLFINLFLFSDN